MKKIKYLINLFTINPNKTQMYHIISAIWRGKKIKMCYADDKGAPDFRWSMEDGFLWFKEE
jgi:hypothetical protein